MIRGATFSPCRRWRYSLTRDWLMGDRGKQTAIMLNPSIACEHYDDPTTTLMVRRAQRDGFQRYEAVNLFARVSTDPKELLMDRDPVGPENDFHIKQAIEDADRIIVAWGNGGSLHGRATAVCELLNGHQAWCFGLTKAGMPKFPRALPRDVELRPFDPGMFAEVV